MSVKSPKRETAPGTGEWRERREYGFEDGVRAAVDRILGLYEAAGRDLVVYINGSSGDVGKTRLQAAIEGELLRRGIASSNLGTGGKSDLRWRREHLPDPEASGHRKFVVFFHTVQAFLIRRGEDFNARTGKDFLPVDFSVAIYRPDRPFEDNPLLEPLGDLVIRNEHAVDLPAKLR